MNHHNTLTPTNKLTTDEADYKAASPVGGVGDGVRGVDIVADTGTTEQLDDSGSEPHADETTTPERHAGRLSGVGKVKQQNKEWTCPDKVESIC